MSVAVSGSGSGSGRPFRFLGSLIALWIAMRIVQLWPADGTLALAEALAPVAVLERDASARAAPRDEALRVPAVPARQTLARRPSFHAARQPAEVMAAAVMLVPTMANVPLPLAPSEQATAGQGVPLAVAAPIAAPGAPLSHGAVAARLHGSGWLIVRGGQAAPFVPQLGGSQAGARLTYLLLPETRLALAGRFSTALRSRQREGAIGLDWQPTRLPVHVVAEQRIGIDNARGGPALGVIAGLGPVPLAAGLTLDGYGQAGVIARDGTEGYADGAVRVSRVVASPGAARIELGLGAWGAAQRGASRLDAGPSASAVVPLGSSGAAVRLSLEWRARLAGNATPTSGPALSIGTDF